MASKAAGAMAGSCDGLTDAILLEAEIAATRRLDWRMALENMAVLLKSRMGQRCTQLKLMQTAKRGDGDGAVDGADGSKDLRFLGRSVAAKPAFPN
jgi:hypothetical protein